LRETSLPLPAATGLGRSRGEDLAMAAIRGLVLALSGIDSAGKSTHRDLLIRELQASGSSSVRLWTRPVICDRYLLDSLVDLRVYFPEDRVEKRVFCKLLRALAVRPDAALCLLVSAEESMRRTTSRGGHNWQPPFPELARFAPARRFLRLAGE
jgi:thymidylate kinase